MKNIIIIACLLALIAQGILQVCKWANQPDEKEMRRMYERVGY